MKKLKTQINRVKIIIEIKMYNFPTGLLGNYVSLNSEDHRVHVQTHANTTSVIYYLISFVILNMRLDHYNTVT